MRDNPPPPMPDDGLRPTPSDRVIYLDLETALIGWRFLLSGAKYHSGWRPTKKWAKRAGRRQMKALT